MDKSVGIRGNQRLMFLLSLYNTLTGERNVLVVISDPEIIGIQTACNRGSGSGRDIVQEFSCDLEYLLASSSHSCCCC